MIGGGERVRYVMSVYVKEQYTPFPLTGHSLTRLPVYRTSRFPDSCSSPLMGTEYTKFVNRTTGSPVNGNPVNEFRKEVPVYRTVPLSGTVCMYARL